MKTRHFGHMNSLYLGIQYLNQSFSFLHLSVFDWFIRRINRLELKRGKMKIFYMKKN